MPVLVRNGERGIPQDQTLGCVRQIADDFKAEIVPKSGHTIGYDNPSWVAAKLSSGIDPFPWLLLNLRGSCGENHAALEQIDRAPSVGPEEIGHRLGESAPGAARVGAVEASNLDAQRRLQGGDRQIGRVAVIAAVDGSARLAALGTSTGLQIR